MEGAGQLSALASLRAGSGKVFWATDSFLFEVPELVRVEWGIEMILDICKEGVCDRDWARTWTRCR